MTNKLQFGMLALVLVFGMIIIGCIDDRDSGYTFGKGDGLRENIFDFQAWMEAHNTQHPRGVLPLPAGVNSSANPSHLGGARNHGQWPFWNTGNQDIVIEGPVFGRNTYQMAVPGAGTGGGAGYGSHGVSFRLSGPNSLGAKIGDKILIAGYMRGTITLNHALGPGVGLRHDGVNDPWGNFHSERWSPGIKDKPFEISWILTKREFESIPSWADGNPTLSVVREPSQDGVIMVIQHFEVLRRVVVSTE